MKKLNTIVCLLAFMSFLWACDDEDTGGIPSSVGDLQAEAREGAIRLKWKVPADSNYLFVRIKYLNPRDGEEVVKNVSIYADTLLIDGLLARDGEYRFELETVNGGGEVSSVLTTSCTALPVQPVTTKFIEKVKLKEEYLSSNCADPEQGKFADLIDGNGDTFFHSNWHEEVPYPQWIEVDLPTPLDQFQFQSQNRKSSDGYPDWVIIQGSNDGSVWNVLLELNEGLPTTSGGKYESEVITTDQPYAKLRYVVKRSFGEKTFFHLAELEIDRVWFDVYDPENE